MGLEFRHAILNERTVCGALRACSGVPLPVCDILCKAQSGADSDGQQFQRLFFCYRCPSLCDFTAMQLLIEALTSGRLLAESEFVSVPPPTGKQFSPRGGGFSRILESAEHLAMKAWVQEFLCTKGVATATEVSQLGYHVDVGSLAAGVFVECGDTEPAKVLALLRQGITIGVIQYDAEEIVWFRPSQEFRRWALAKEAESWGIANGSSDEV